MFKFTHSVIYIAIAALPLVIDYFLKRKYKKWRDALKKSQEDDFYYQSIFLNMKNFNCKEHITNKVECNYYCSYVHLKTLCNFISSAKESISICMYTLTLLQIHSALIRAHENGINVRIITDKIMLKTNISQINFNKLSEKGVRYKVQPFDQSMMHHKFCLIDKDSADNAKMFFGTMNLTFQAVVANFDNYVITNNRAIIARYNEEFEELWESFH